MKEILTSVSKWIGNREPVALATLVRVFRSAPRQPGAAMAVSGSGEVVGSVSGGCVEAALYDEAQAVLETGRPRLVSYGIADEQAWGVGLTCGGTIEVFIERIDWEPALMPALAAALQAGEPVGLATVIEGERAGGKLLVRGCATPGALPAAGATPGAPPAVGATPGAAVLGGTGSAVLDETLAKEAFAMLRQGLTGIRRFGPGGERRRDETAVFIESFAPPPRMFVFGAIDFAAATVRIGKFLGYRVTLCDARPVFATRARFPDADEIVVAWPHEFLAGTDVGPRDAICVLTHDPKFDVPVLLAALRTPAAFIGALGSRNTHERRHRALQEAGVGEAGQARISSPVGLDIGGQTPEETAVSIAAELIALRTGRSGGRLQAAAGRIHGAAETVTA